MVGAGVSPARTVHLLSSDARAIARYLVSWGQSKGVTLSEAARAIDFDSMARGFYRPTPEMAARAKAALAELLVLDVVKAWLGERGERAAENAIYRLRPEWGEIDFDVDIVGESGHPPGMTSRP